MPRGRELFEPYSIQDVTLVWSRNNLHLYGGAIYAMREGYNFDVIISLAEYGYGLTGVIGDSELAEALHVPTIILLQTRDGAPPPIGADQLRNLAVKLHEMALEKAEPFRVFVGCSGGRGRTGTMLAALIWYLQAQNFSFEITDPIGYLRKHYSEKAVETNSQLEWLEEMGVPTCGHKPSYEVYDVGFRWPNKTQWK